MKKALKLLITSFLIFNMTNNYVFANTYDSVEKNKITVQFYEAMQQLKNGNYDEIKDCIYVSSIEKSNDIIKKIPGASDVFDWLKPVKEIVDTVKPDQQIKKIVTQKIFESYEFNINNIEKESQDTFNLALDINMPNVEYYNDLEKLIVEYEDSEAGKISNGLNLLQNYALGGALNNVVDVDLDLNKYKYIYDNVNYLNYDKKTITRTIRIKENNNSYKIDISDLVGYDMVGGGNAFTDKKMLSYKGNDVDDKNIYNYLFIPMWKMIRNDYKLSN